MSVPLQQRTTTLDDEMLEEVSARRAQDHDHGQSLGLDPDPSMLPVVPRQYPAVLVVCLLSDPCPSTVAYDLLIALLDSTKPVFPTAGILQRQRMGGRTFTMPEAPRLGQDRPSRLYLRHRPRRRLLTTKHWKTSLAKSPAPRRTLLGRSLLHPLLLNRPRANLERIRRPTRRSGGPILKRSRRRSMRTRYIARAQDSLVLWTDVR